MKVVVCGGGIGGSFLVNSLAPYVGKDKPIQSLLLIEPKTYMEATNAVLGAVHHPDYVKEFSFISRSADYAWDQRVTHIAAKAVSIDKQNRVVKLDNGHNVSYDILCIATGVRSLPEGAIWRPSPKVTTIKERLEEIAKYRETIKAAKTVLVIGGGVVGVELISELAERYPKTRFHYAVSDKEVLTQFPSVVRKVARRHIQRFKNVEMHTSTGRIESPGPDGVYRIGNYEIRPDLVIKCFPSGLNTDFIPSEWLDDKQQVKVNKSMQVEGEANVFAFGDIANISTDKSAKAAVDEARFVKRNVLAQCRGQTPHHNFHRPRDGLVIRLGSKEAMLYYWPMAGLYGITMSGSYAAGLVREILVSKILYECTTGDAIDLQKGGHAKELAISG